VPEGFIPLTKLPYSTKDNEQHYIMMGAYVCVNIVVDLLDMSASSNTRNQIFV
jgi:hypothetical protein